MIGIVSVTSDTKSVRIALLSHHWTEFQTVRGLNDWAGLGAFGYRYAPGDRAFLKDCVFQGVAPPPDPQAERAARRDLCQAELDHLAEVREVGMYRQNVTQLARRGLHWRGRCLTEDEVASALGAATE
jgi:hypothetical protein